MEFPKLRAVAQSVETVTAFGGYRHLPRVPEGEWYDMENLTSDDFPLLAPRGQRQRLETEGSTSCITVNGGLCRLWELPGLPPAMKMKNYRLELPKGIYLELQLAAGNKQLVNMGGYILLFPDKLWFNVAAALEAETLEGNWGRMEAQCYATELRFQVCKRNGEPVDFSASEEKPAEPEDGTYWIDTTDDPPVLKRWYQEAGLWMPEESYLHVQLPVSEDGSADLRKGDALVGEAVACHRLRTPEGEETEGSLYIPENPVIMEMPARSGYEYFGIIIPGIATCGMAEDFLTAETEVTWRRPVPDMDFVTESGNRLWGCKYGSTENGFVNEIYASKLGDFRNFYSFQGISTDSYTLSVGADGAFTGAVSYQGKPLFFKENTMLRIYGDYPADFRLQELPCQGIREGCAASAAVVNGVLYYKSRSGICAFDGSLPVQVGAALGQTRYYEAVAGGLGDKYYICMTCDTGWALFVYDTAKGLWHREDGLPVSQFLSWENKMYAITGGDRQLTVLSGGEAPNEGPVHWMAQSGPMGLRSQEAKYVSRLRLRLSLTAMATVRVYVRYDSEPHWEHLYTVNGTRLQSFTLPIRAKRCQHMELRLEGEGEARLHSLSRVWEEGSDVL